jgi:glutamate dehydrogenase (NAD(P)+)
VRFGALDWAAEAFNTFEMSEGEKVYMRDAAYMVAIKKVVTAMELRGWI